MKRFDFKRVIKSSDLWILVLMVVATSFLTWRVFDGNSMMGSGLLKWFLLAEILVELVAFGVLRWMKKKNFAMEKKYLFIAILLGILFIFLMPLGEIPDEAAHFKRAYGVTQGFFVAENREEGAGNEMPKNIVQSFPIDPYKGAYKDTWERLFENVSSEETFQTYTNTAIYNPICYFPQIIGALIGRLFGMSIVGMAYLMRVLNFVVFVALIYFAIKITPRYKTVILFISLLPITIQEGISLSPDALTNGLSIFMVAYVLYLVYEKKTKMNRKELIGLYLIAILIGFLKIVYAPLVLLYLTIPAERFGTKRAKWLNLGGIALLMLILDGSWLILSMKVPFETMRPGANLDSKAQLKGIFESPIGYAGIMLRSIDAWWYFWLWNMLGIELGAFSFKLPAILVLITLVVLVVILTQRENLVVKKFDRTIYIIVAVLIIGTMLTTLYLQWTEVGAMVIDGVQGRYFLPILILIPVMIALGTSSNQNRKIQEKTSRKLISERGVLCYGIFINAVALATIAIQNI